MKSNRLSRLPILAILAACHSGSAGTNADRGESQPTTVLPAVELARTYGLEIRPEVPDGVPIRVVDGRTGNPVAEALVVSVDEYEFTYSDAGDGGIRWNARSLLKESGAAYATGSDGVTRLASPTEPNSIFVWHDGAFGRTTLEANDREERVVSLAPRALTVEVIDRNGAPKPGVPIQLGKCSLEPMSPGTTIGATGSDGRLEIPALELERGVHRSCGRRDLVMIGGLVGGYELLAADAPRLEPVRLVLPECGAVELEIRTRYPWPTIDAGMAWPHFSLLVSGSKRGDPRGLKRESESLWERSLALPVGTGRIRLEPVEVGTILSVRLVIKSDESTSTFENLRPIDANGSGIGGFEGPKRAGETRHVVLESESLGAPIEDSESAPEGLNRVMKQAAETANEKRMEAKREASVAGSIDVAVRLDVAIDPCWLSARLDENADPFQHETCPWIDVNGRATMRQVSPGTHFVTITARRITDRFEEIPLCQIDDVVVRPSEHLRDPRLLNIDLRGKLRVHRLDVVDDHGNPLSGRLRITRESAPGSIDELWFHGGRVDFLTPVGERRQGSVEVNRFRKLDLDLDPNVSDPASTAGGARRRIVMKHGIPIRLALAPGFDLPPGPHDPIYVGVSEVPHQDDGLDELRTVELAPGADLRFDLAEPGEWNVIFLRSQDVGTDRDLVTECHAVETTITVTDDSREQQVTVTPDRDCWDALVRSLAR